MKNLFLTLGLAILLSFLNGCTFKNENLSIDNDQQTALQALKSLLKEYEIFDLKPYEINASIYLPGEKTAIGSSLSPEVEHEEGGFKWKLSIGEQFQIIIQDWGREDMITEKRLELKGHQKYYKIEFIEDSPDFISYKKTLNVSGLKEASKDVGIEHISYHCCGQRTIAGINYMFSSTADGIPKPTLKYLSASIKSVTPNSILVNP